jgi:hypothetical protein
MSADTATARAQAADALELAAQALKRQLGVTRKALQAVRQAQAGLLGINVIYTETPEGSQSAPGKTEVEAYR